MIGLITFCIVGLITFCIGVLVGIVVGAVVFAKAISSDDTARYCSSYDSQPDK